MLSMNKFICFGALFLLFVSVSYSQVSKQGDKLINASKDGNMAEVRKLIELGASPFYANDKGQTPLMFAAQQGNLEIVKVLIAEGANINAVDVEGCTALMYTASGGHFPKIIKYLIEKGAKINARDKKGNTALHFAAMRGNADAASALLKRNADVTIKNNEGKSALDLAKENKFDAIVKLITTKEYLNEDIWAL